MQTFSLCYYSNFLEDLIDNATYNKNKINGFIFMIDSRTSVFFSLLINDIFSRPVKAV